MSEDRKEKYDAYGHLRKNMEEKQLQKGVTSSGTPKIVQVFYSINVIIIYFGFLWIFHFRPMGGRP
ncbi:MAG: hypothetical protein ACPHNX_03590 [Candidatus Kariarchaeum pelagius]